MNIQGLTTLLKTAHPLIVYPYDLNQDNKDKIATQISNAFTTLAQAPSSIKLNQINNAEVKGYYKTQEHQLQSSFIILSAIEHVMKNNTNLSSNEIESLAGLTVGLATNSGYRVASGKSMLKPGTAYTAESLTAELDRRGAIHNEKDSTNALFATQTSALNAIETGKQNLATEIQKQGDLAQDELLAP